MTPVFFTGQTNIYDMTLTLQRHKTAVVENLHDHDQTGLQRLSVIGTQSLVFWCHNGAHAFYLYPTWTSRFAPAAQQPCMMLPVLLGWSGMGISHHPPHQTQLISYHGSWLLILMHCPDYRHQHTASSVLFPGLLQMLHHHHGVLLPPPKLTIPNFGASVGCYHYTLLLWNCPSAECRVGLRILQLTEDDPISFIIQAKVKNLSEAAK